MTHLPISNASRSIARARACQLKFSPMYYGRGNTSVMEPLGEHQYAEKGYIEVKLYNFETNHLVRYRTKVESRSGTFAERLQLHTSPMMCNWACPNDGVRLNEYGLPKDVHMGVL